MLLGALDHCAKLGVLALEDVDLGAILLRESLQTHGLRITAAQLGELTLLVVEIRLQAGDDRVLRLELLMELRDLTRLVFGVALVGVGSLELILERLYELRLGIEPLLQGLDLTVVVTTRLLRRHRRGLGLVGLDFLLRGS